MMIPTPSIRPTGSAGIARILVTLLVVGPVHAVQPQDAPLGLAEHNPQRAWYQDYDPTLVNRRVLSELSYESDGDDNLDYKLTSGFAWHF
jgi:hypothetical protein